VSTFIKCAYWVSPKAANYLKKGTIISVFGRIGLDVYKNMEGEPQGTLTFHVNQIRFITGTPKPRPAGTATGTPTLNQQPALETKDDLPF
jgi:single-strand DNA-binding protein